MNVRFSRAFPVLAVLASAWAGVASAQSSSANCTVLASGALAFGAYDSLRGAPTTGTGTVNVDCRGAVRKYTVEVRLGPGSHGTFAARRMRHATVVSQFLTYQLYRNAGLTEVLGDGTAGTVTGIIDPDISQTFTFHGAIPPRQNVIAGSYADTVVVTIVF